MKANLTYSSTVRNEGNNWYKKFNSSNEFSVNKDYLNKAINCYENSLQNSNCPEDSYKTSKNLVIAYYQYSNLYSNFDLDKEQNFLNYMYSLKLFCKYIKQELLHSRKYFKDYNNFNSRKEYIYEILESHISILKNYQYFSQIYSLLDNNFKEEYELYIISLSSLAQYYFNYGFTLYESDLKLESKQYFNNSLDMILILRNYPYLKHLTEENKKKINSIYSSNIFYIRRISADTFIKKGDEFFNECIYGDESLQMDYYFDALDQYRNAYCLYNSEEDNDERKVDDIETEAISLYKIANACYVIQKRTKNLYSIVMNCINLGLSMYPINVEEKSWYKKAKIIATKLRGEKLAEEGENVDEVKEKYKKDNQNIFDELKSEYDKGTKNFVLFILNKYPYDKFNGKVDDIIKDFESNKKKCLLKLSASYHPDKYTKATKKEQERFYVIEEISSYINSAYNELKG